MKYFKIKYVVDNGAWYFEDVAIVKAMNNNEAKEKLRDFINHIDSETCINKIIDVEEFNDDIFTMQCGTT